MSEFKILAINGSPRARKSNTDRLLKPLLAGAQQAGATMEILYAAELDIKDCLGCFCCWQKTPGRCVINDDMAAVLEKILASDIVIWGTPLYHYGMTARLKRILERTLPLAKPYIVKRDGHYHHPARYPDRHSAYMLVANCGFPERHHFDAILEHFRMLAIDGASLIGAILCPAGEVLAYVDSEWYYAALRNAGREIVTTGKVSDETAALLAKDIIPLDAFLASANASWQVPGETAPTLAEAMGEAPQDK